MKRHERAAGAWDVPTRKSQKIKKKERSSVCARKGSTFSETVDKVKGKVKVKVKVSL